MIELLRRFLGPYRTKSIVGVLTKVVEVVFEVLTPLVVALMVDEGIRKSDTGAVLRLGIVLVVFAVVSYAFTFICQRLAAQVSQGVGTDVRNALYAHVNTLSEADVERFGTPSLLTRVTNDVNQVQLAVALCVRMLTRWPLLALGSMIAALTIDIYLGLVFLVCLPAITVVFALVMRASVPYYRSMQAKLDHVSLVVREALGGMRVMRAFGQEHRELTRSQEAIADQARTAVAVGRLSSLLNPATFIIMYSGVAAIAYVGGMRVNLGDLTTGEVMAFVSYMTQTLVSISYLANLVVVIMRGQTSSVRILEVLDCVPSLVGGETMQPVPAAKDEVAALELREATLTYEGSAVPGLCDITLSVPQGGMLGVIGGTGSGKSTLVKLLPRLYDATAGSVHVLGRDVRRYPFAQLRQLVSVVPQKATLVSGTLRSNLTWRHPQATDDELWEALRLAQAEDFVRALPEGLDAPVEANGANFSGGQRQRLTIARAVVGSPRIIVLDDAASALDFATDARLRRALRSMGDDVTTVIVSQRVSAVRDADAIVVLDHGNMAGLGTHEELRARCSVYDEICVSQLEGRR